MTTALLPFDLEKALVNPDRVVNGLRRHVRQLTAFNIDNASGRRVFGVVDGKVDSWYETGRWNPAEVDLADLYLLPLTKTVWVNVYMVGDRLIRTGADTYSTEKDARDGNNPHGDKYLGAYLITVNLDS